MRTAVVARGKQCRSGHSISTALTRRLSLVAVGTKGMGLVGFGPAPAVANRRVVLLPLQDASRGE